MVDRSRFPTSAIRPTADVDEDRAKQLLQNDAHRTLTAVGAGRLSAPRWYVDPLRVGIQRRKRQSAGLIVGQCAAFVA
jgi:hypothetical protein